jgi:stage II sporulation protein D
VQFQGSAIWDIKCDAGKIRLRTAGAGDGQVPEEFVLPEPVTLASATGTLKWEEKPVRQGLRVYSSSRRGQCEVVNVMDLESYLVGVVNGEFSSSWNEESIAAQVIAARSYALYQMVAAQKRMAHYDVEADTRDQVYAGAGSEDQRARMIVEKTRGQVLVAPGSQLPVKAFYHSTCGGTTDSPDHVFGEHQAGLKRGVACPYCGSSPRFKWSLRLSARELKQLIGFAVARISIDTRWDSGRVRNLKIVHEGEAARVGRLSATELRARIGAERMRSTAFDVYRDGNGDFVFSGRGNGHGVGMCQWGAKEMGERGKAYSSILSHYYPDSSLRRVW